MYRFIMKIFTDIPYTVGGIKTGNTRVHALIQFDLHSFDQNILSSQERGWGGVLRVNFRILVGVVKMAKNASIK